MALNYTIDGKAHGTAVTGNGDKVLDIKVYDKPGNVISASNPFYGREDSTAKVVLTGTGVTGTKELNIVLKAYDNGNGGSAYIKFDNTSITDTNEAAHTVVLTGKTNAQQLDIEGTGLTFDLASSKVNDVTGKFTSPQTGVAQYSDIESKLGEDGLYTFAITVNIPANAEQVTKTYTVSAAADDTVDSTGASDTVTINQKFEAFVRFVAANGSTLTSSEVDTITFNSNGQFVSVSKNGTAVPSATGVAIDSNVSWTLS